jgi:hypothetical protein
MGQAVVSVRDLLSLPDQQVQFRLTHASDAERAVALARRRSLLWVRTSVPPGFLEVACGVRNLPIPSIDGNNDNGYGNGNGDNGDMLFTMDPRTHAPAAVSPVACLYVRNRVSGEYTLRATSEALRDSANGEVSFVVVFFFSFVYSCE